MNGRRLLVALSAAVLTIGLALPAQAQSKSRTQAPAAKSQTRAAPPTKAKPAKQGKETQVQPKQAGDKKPVARKVVRLEEMRVEGRVQKPQAMFLMPRASVNPGDEDRVESFLPKAKDAVNRDPF